MASGENDSSTTDHYHCVCMYIIFREKVTTFGFIHDSPSDFFSDI